MSVKTGGDLSSFAAFAKSAPIKSSVKKLKPVADLVRGMPVNDALLQLSFCNKKVAGDMHKVLKSAISNAENNFNYDIDTLYVSRIDLCKKFTLKRMRAGAKGRGKRILKRYSTVSVFVDAKADVNF